MNNLKPSSTFSFVIWAAVFCLGGFLVVIKGAQATGITVGNPNFNMGVGENAFFGQTSATNAAGNFLLFERGPNNVIFRIDHLGNITTSGQVLGSNTLWSQSGSNLFASSTTWNVGIGTTNPGAKLQVSGGKLVVDNTSGTWGQMQIGNTINAETSLTFLPGVTAYGTSPTASYKWNIGAGINGISSSKFGLGRDGSTYLTFDTSGNVGIGTTNPGSKLDIYSGPTTDYGLTSTPSLNLGISGSQRGFIRLQGTTASRFGVVQMTTENMHIDSSSAGGSLYINYYSQRPTLINPQAGNVGIGTSNPVYKLDVTGDARLTGTLYLNDPVGTQNGLNIKNLTLTSDPFYNQAIIGYDYDAFLNADKRYTITLGGGFSGSAANLFDGNTGSSIVATTGTTGTIEVNLVNMQHYFYGLVLTSPWGTGYGFSSSFLIEKYYDPNSGNGWDSNCDNSEGDLAWGTVADVTGFSGSQYVTRSNLGNGICRIRVTFRNVVGSVNQIQVGDLSAYQFYYGYKGLSAKTTGDTIFGNYDFSDGALRVRINNSTGNSFFNGGNLGVGTTNPVFKLSVSNGTGNVIYTGGGQVSGLPSTQTEPDQAVSHSYVHNNFVGRGLGVTGYLSRWSSTSTISTSTVFDNGSNVGIGLTNPSQALHVYKSSSSTAGITVQTDSGDNSNWNAINLVNPASSGWGGAGIHPININFKESLTNTVAAIGAGYDQAGSVYVDFHSIYSGGYKTDNDVVMRVKGDGKVGIGTTNPSAKLEIASSTNIEGLRIISSNYSPFVIRNSANSADIFRIDQYGNITGGIGNSTAWTRSTTTNQLYVTNTGDNVGIGTTNPMAKLSISGGEGTYNAPNFGSTNLGAINILNTTSDRRNAITFSAAGSVNAQAGIYVHQDGGAGTHMYLATTDSYATGPQARLTVRNSGNVGVGTTNPTTRLQISGNGTVNTYRGVVRIDDTGSSKWAGIAFPDSAAAADSTANNYYFIGRGNAIADRTLSIHIPTAGNYGSGSAPIFGVFSTGADKLFSIEAATGKGYVKGNIGIGFTNPLSKLTVDGGLHVGGNSDVGDNNLLVDGTFRVGELYYSDLKTIALPLGTEAWVNLATIPNNGTVRFQIRTGSQASEEIAEVKIFGTYHIAQTGISVERQTYSEHLREVRVTGSDGGLKTVYVKVRTSSYAPTITWRVIESKGVVTINNVEATPTGGLAHIVSGNLITSTNAGSFIMGNVAIGTTTPQAVKLFVSGGTGNVINAGGGRVANMQLVPISNDEAASKYYVDNNFMPSSAGVKGSGTGGYHAKWMGTVSTSTITNSIIYDNGTNVGIGTANPGAKLHIKNSTGIVRQFFDSGDGVTKYDASMSWLDNGQYAWTMNKSTSNNFEMLRYVAGAYQNKPIEITNSNSDINFNAGALMIKGAGNVGVGVTNPVYKLDVNGNVRLGEFTIESSNYFKKDYTTSLTTAGYRRDIVIPWETVDWHRAILKLLITTTDGSVSPYGRIEIVYNIIVNNNGGVLSFYKNDVQTNEAFGDLTSLLYVKTPEINGTDVRIPLVWKQTTGRGIKITLEAWGSASDIAYIKNASINNEYNNSDSTSTVQAVNIISNVGIGTTSPVAKLAVSGGTGNVIYTGGGQISGLPSTQTQDDQAVSRKYLHDNFTASSTLSSSSFWSGSLAGNIYNANTGNVGVGIANPTTKFYVSGTSTFSELVGLLSSHANGTTDEVMTVSSVSGYGGMGLVGYAVDINQRGVKLQAEASQIAGGYGSANTLVLNTRQNKVGINTDVPVNRLDVEGAVAVGASYSGSFAAPANGMIVEGNLGVGTTNVGQKLVVDGTAQINANLNVAGPTDANRFINLRYNSGSWPDYASYLAQTGASDIAGSRGLIINTNIGQSVSNYGINLAIASSSKLFVQYTGNVGIGKLNPSRALLDFATTSVIDMIHVSGGYVAGLDLIPIRPDHAVPLGYLQSNYSPGGVTGSGTAGYHAKWTGTTTIANSVIYDNGANVGIGTTLPGAKLTIIDPRDSVSDTATYNDFALLLGHGVSNNNTAVGLAFHPSVSSLGTPGAAIIAKRVGGYGVSDLIFKTKEIGTASDPVLPRMTITSTGRVGIGTTNPGARLEINGGDVYIWNNGSNPRFLVGDSAGGGNWGGFRWESTNDLIQIGTDTGGYVLNLNEASNVGVGTTNPTVKLDVAGDVNLNNQALTAAGSINRGYYVYKSGTTAYGLKLQYTGSEYGTMLFGPNQANRFISFGKVGAALEDDDMVEQMRLDLDTGNLGIGTTNPTAKLTIVSGSDPAIDVGSKQIAGVPSPTNPDHAVNKQYVDNNFSPLGNSSKWGGTTTANIWNLNSGNVGIGTTTPAAKLHVYGSTRIGEGDAGVGSPKLVITTNETNADLLIQSRFAATEPSTSLTFYNVKSSSGGTTGRINVIQTDYQNNYMSFETESANTLTERMRIHTNGSIGIGTTSPATKLHIYDASSGPILTMSGLDTNYRGLTIKNTANTEQWFAGNNTSNNFVVRRSGTTDYLTIANNGNVGIGVNNPGYKLEVAGTSTATTLSLGSNGNVVDPGLNTLPGTISLNYSTTANNAYGIGIGALRNGKYDIWSQTGAANGGGYRWYIGTSEKMTIDYTGKVGIGTTTIDVPLDVTGANPTGNIIDVNGGQITGLPAVQTADGQAVSRKYLHDNFTSTSTISSSSFWAGSLAGNISNANSGNVGIGVTNPAQKLDVAGVINTSVGYRISNAATAGQYLRGNGTNFVASAIQASDVPTLNQNTSGYAGTLYYEDNRIISPSELAIRNLKFGFTSYNNNNSSPYADFLHMRSYGDSSGGSDNLLVFNKSGLGMRIYQQQYGTTTAYASYKDVLLSDNSPTTNYLTKYTSTGNTVSAGKSVIYDNGTNVGIGRTNLRAPLDFASSTNDVIHVAGGQVAGLNSTPSRADHATSKEYVDNNFAPIGGTSKWGSGANNIWNLNSGYVGIGTTNPEVKLSIATSTNIDKDSIQELIRITGASNTENAGELPSAGTGITFYNSWSGGTPYSVARIAGRASQTYDGGLQFDVSDNTGAGQSNFTTAMEILSNGNIGIGTSSPLSKLNIYGTYNLAGGLTFGDGDTGIYEGSDDFMYFGINGAATAGLSTVGLFAGLGSTGNAYILKQISSSVLPAYSFVGDTTTGIGRAGGSIGSLIAGGVNVLNWVNSGNVGIGTTNPLAKFYVSGNQLINIFKSSDTTASGYIEGAYENDAGNRLIMGSIGSGYTSADWATSTYIYNTGAGRDMYIKSQDRMDLFTGGTALANRRVSILSDGKTGIGTTTPVALLSVHSSSGEAIRVNNQISGLPTPTNPDHAVNKQYVDNNFSPIGGTSKWGSGSNNIWNLNSASVGIGTTNPIKKLDVAGGIIAQSGYNVSDAATDNLVVNGDFEMGDRYGWNVGTVVTGGYSGNYTLQVTGSQNLNSDDYIPVDPTRDILQLEAWVKKSVAGTTPGVLYFGYYAYNENKTLITSAPCGSYCYFAASNWTIPVDGAWHKVSATTVGEGTSYPNFPVGTRYVRIMGLMNYNASADSVTLIDHISLKRLTKGPLIAGNNFSSTNLVNQHQYSTLYTTAANNLILGSPANVGIGVTNPTVKLDVSGAIRTDNQLISTIANGTSPLAVTSATVVTNLNADLWDGQQFASYLNQALLTSSSPSFTDLTLSGGDLTINNNNGGINFSDTSAYWLKTATNWGLYWDTTLNQVKFNGSGTTRASIDLDDGAAYFNGNVGIGTTTPVALFSVHSASGEAIRVNNHISGLPSPTNPDHAVNKQYVDNNFATIGSASKWGSGSNNIWNLNSANVGIGTSNPLYKLDVSGAGRLSGILYLGSTIGIDPNITNGIVDMRANGTGGYSMGYSQGSGSFIYYGGTTSSKFSIDNTGTGYFSGNVGIGLTGPVQKLEVDGSIRLRTTGNALEFTNANVKLLRTGNALRIDSYDGWQFYDMQGSAERIRITSSGNVGIGLTNPATKLEVLGTLTVSTSAGNGLGKITAGTFDPPYTIEGAKYATYLPSMIGVKEETTGTIQLTRKGKGDLYEKRLNMLEAARGSDLWLFSRVTNIKNRGLDGLTVLLSPHFEGTTWYEKDEARGAITIYARPKNQNIVPEVSYRLTAPRFDEGEFKNQRPASDPVEGFNLDKLIK